MPYQMNLKKIQGGTFNDVGRDQTNNTYHGVVSHHVQIESMSVACSHSGQQSVKRTMYDEFEYVKLGQVIPLETLATEDLSGLELSYRSGRMVGHLKTCVKTCTVTIGQDKATRLVAMMYEGEDAHKAWEHDFRYVSGIKEPGFAHLFGINQSSQIPMLIFHHTEFTPVTSMEVEDLDSFLDDLSWNFDKLVKKDFPFWVMGFIDGMQDRLEQLESSWDRLDNGSSPKEWDQVLQQFLHILHVWGLEIDSEAGEKDYNNWVRVKDSGSIQELDDSNEDFLNTATSSITNPNSGTCSTQKDEDIRMLNSNTTQGTGTPMTTLSIKPTQHGQLTKAQHPSPAATKQVPSRCSDEGATRQDDDDNDLLNNTTSPSTKPNGSPEDIKPFTWKHVQLWNMVLYWSTRRGVRLLWMMVVVLAGMKTVFKVALKWYMWRKKGKRVTG